MYAGRCLTAALFSDRQIIRALTERPASWQMPFCNTLFRVAERPAEEARATPFSVAPISTLLTAAAATITSAVRPVMTLCMVEKGTTPFMAVQAMTESGEAR